MTGPGRHERILHRSHPRAPYYYNGKGGGSGASVLPQRRITRVNIPVSSLTTNGTLTLPNAAGIVILKVRTQKPCWLRLYSTAEDRELDEERDIDDVPATPIILDVLFTEPDHMEEFVWDGDEWGAFAFNGDDPAKSVLYYRLEVESLEDLESLGAGSFFAEGDFASGEEPRAGIGLWNDPEDDGFGGARYRYYEEFGMIRQSGISNVPVTFGIAQEENSVAEMALWRSNTLDSATFFYYWTCFVRTGIGGYAVPNAAHIRAGVARHDAGHVTASIIHWNDTEETTLDSEEGIEMGPGDNLVMRMELTMANVGEEDEGPLVTLIVNGTPVCSAMVPPEVVALADHRSIGFIGGASSPPEAPLGWGGCGIVSYAVSGASPRITFDIGYLPIELPGGTLETPVNEVPVP